MSEKGKFRISPVKNRDSLMVKKSLKPFSSSIIQDKKLVPCKQDLVKMNSKIQLIKSKVMKSPSKMRRTDSKKTLQSQWMGEGALNDSVDMESEEESTKDVGNSANLLRSRFEDRPSTLFFHYPKCCGMESKYLERVYNLEKANLTYKIAGSEYRCIVNSLELNGFTKS